VAQKGASHEDLLREALAAWGSILRGGSIDGSDFSKTLGAFGVTRETYVANWLRGVR
jgi:hypothetical protein